MDIITLIRRSMLITATVMAFESSLPALTFSILGHPSVLPKYVVLVTRPIS